MRTKIILTGAIALAVVCLFSATSYAYVYSGHKWPSPAMGESYVINPNCTDPDVGTTQNIIDAINAGARAWVNEGNANFTFPYGGATGATLPNDGNQGGSYNNANEIMFVQAGQSYWYFLQNPNVIAVTWIWYNSATNLNFECDLAFNDGTNPGYIFSAVGEPAWNEMDVWDIAAHEFGHYLSLSHTPVNTATMYPYSQTGETWKRDLDYDDVAGIQYIYGIAPNINPVLTNGLVTPSTGGPATTFSYRVNYVDANQGFAASRVTVDGVLHDMTLYSGVPFNGIYTYDTTVPYSTAGHTYSFSCDDGQGGSDLLPVLGSFTGPTIIPVTVDLVCNNPTVPQGGTLLFDVTLGNQSTTQPYAITATCYVILPNQQQYGPVLGPANLALPANSSILRTRNLNIPATAPLGSYTYFINITQGGNLIATDSFPFTVTGPNRGDNAVQFPCITNLDE